MQLQLTATQFCPLALRITDRRGNPAQVQNPVWTSSDTTIATVTPDPADPLKAVVAAVGPVGAALISFDGDADLGEGVLDIIGTLDVVVIAGTAFAVEIQPGTPAEQAPGARGVRR
jgi:hypothetical protein